MGNEGSAGAEEMPLVVLIDEMPLSRCALVNLRAARSWKNQDLIAKTLRKVGYCEQNCAGEFVEWPGQRGEGLFESWLYGCLV